MQITEAYCTNNNRYKAAQKFTPQGVVLHSIGTPQPKARVLYNYWQNNKSSYVVHYMVDDTEILHCMPDNYLCYHVCSPGNSKWIGIEMGEPKQIKYTSGAKFTVSDLKAAQDYCEKTYKNSVWLIAYLCKKYGWNPDTDIYTHYEVTMKKLSNTDHVDPQHLWDGLGMGYNLAKLRKDVKSAMGGITVSTTPTSSSSAVTSSHPTLKLGSTGMAVKELQTTLNSLNYNCGTVDGDFGAKTLDAVKEFQKDNNLTQDGVVGANTWAALDRAKNDDKEKTDELYRIRKSWSDSSSQIGAYKSLEYAIAACKSGYNVYDANGKQVYPEASYMVRITANSLNIRTGPGTNYGVVGSIAKGGGYTIVETKDNWGKLKSGAGWICLDYTEKV